MIHLTHYSIFWNLKVTKLLHQLNKWPPKNRTSTVSRGSFRICIKACCTKLRINQFFWETDRVKIICIFSITLLLRPIKITPRIIGIISPYFTWSQHQFLKAFPLHPTILELWLQIQQMIRLRNNQPLVNKLDLVYTLRTPYPMIKKTYICYI